MRFTLIMLLFFCSLTVFSSNKNIKTIFISAETKTCDAGVMRKECLRVKWSKNEKNWEYFYDEIQGFEKRPGFEYHLKISISNIANPPEDSSAKKYQLIKLISKKRVIGAFSVQR